MNTSTKTNLIKNSIFITALSCSLFALGTAQSEEDAQGSQYETGSGTAGVDKSITTEGGARAEDAQGSQYEQPEQGGSALSDMKFEDMDTNQDGTIDSSEFSTFQEGHNKGGLDHQEGHNKGGLDHDAGGSEIEGQNFEGGK